MVKIIKALFKKKETMAKRNTTRDKFDNAFTLYTKCEHPALAPIMIGCYPVWFGANKDIGVKTIHEMDYICALSGYMPTAYFGAHVTFINCPLTDMGGVPDFWDSFIDDVVTEIKAGKKILAYCVGGHGRTGTFGASLISVLEPDTPDPIDAMRERHCYKAVETLRQADAVFALRNVELPQRYVSQHHKNTSTTGNVSTKGSKPGSPTTKLIL